MSAVKFSQHEASDIEAASEAIYVEAADKMFDNRTLGRDLLGLAALFFVIVTYHIQNPLLQYDTQFGSAFRNGSLQIAMLGGLVVCAVALAREHRRTLTRNPLQLGAAIVLGAYTLYMVLAILLGFNLSGALVGVPQEVFTQRLSDSSPTDLLDSGAVPADGAASISR